MPVIRRNTRAGFELHEDVGYGHMDICDRCGNYRKSPKGKILNLFFYWKNYYNGAIDYIPGHYCSRICAGVK